MNVFLCRTERDSPFRERIFGNPLLLWGIAFEIGLILLIDYTSWGNRIFGTAPIPMDVWLFVLPFALTMLLLEALRKGLIRRFE